VASQAFASVESQLGRRQQERQFNASQALSKSQFGEQMALASKQFALEEKIQKFNMDQAKKKTGLAGLRQKVGSGDYMGAGEFVADPMGLWG
jgi:hypothetical protein